MGRRAERRGGTGEDRGWGRGWARGGAGGHAGLTGMSESLVSRSCVDMVLVLKFLG